MTLLVLIIAAGITWIIVSTVWTLARAVVSATRVGARYNGGYRALYRYLREKP